MGDRLRAAQAEAVIRRLTRVSLRARLLLITMVLLVTGLAVSNVLITRSLRGHLVSQVDDQTQRLAGVISHLPPRIVSGNEGVLARSIAARSNLISDLYIAEMAPDGGTEGVLRPPSSTGTPELPRLDAAEVAARHGRPFEVPNHGDGARWRVFTVARPRGGSVTVAASLHGVDATIGRLWADCLVIGGGVLAGLAMAGWFAVRAGLRPLHRIEGTAAAIAAGDLSDRVPDLAAPRTEVGKLSAALNSMLAQLEAAFRAQADSEARMRRFIADASHELRTPLFGIRGFAELYRMGGLPERADVDRTMRRIETEAGRLARMVEDLLLLARLDGAGDVPAHQAPMDLRTLAADALHDLRALAPSRPVRLAGLDGGPPATAQVLADEARLRQAVTNLIGNAVAHTPPGSPLHIKVGTESADAVLAVEDEGPGLTDEQAAHVFERFYRVDDARTRTADGGAGLGLAIVHSVVAAQGGRVELRTAPGEGAAFRIVLPAHNGCRL